jgi:UPF0716 family protein affecting phage T7 exclusion
LGLLLMLRWTRLLVLESLLAIVLPQLMRGFQMRQTHAAQPRSSEPRDPKPHSGPDIIEGDYRVEDDDR